MNGEEHQDEDESIETESDDEAEKAWRAHIAQQMLENGATEGEVGDVDDDDEAERVWQMLQERNAVQMAQMEEEVQLQRLREINAMLDVNPDEDDDGLLDSEHAICYDHLTFDTAVAEGSFGRLFKGEYLGVDVAIKNLFMTDDAEEDAKYLAREVSALKGIRHPNVVSFIGVCVHESGTYIVTEWIPHGDLTNELKKDKVISWHKRLSYAKDAAAAMAYLHARKVIHRDLKAENLLLADNDSIKVCDLGFARTSKAKRRLSIAGTQLYMAPEVMVGAEYDEKCDVFSYGVVLFEIIARQPPPKRSLVDNFGFNPEQLAPCKPEDCPEDFWCLMLDCVKGESAERPAFPVVLARLKALLKQVPKPSPEEANKVVKEEGEKVAENVPPSSLPSLSSPLSSSPVAGALDTIGAEKMTKMRDFWETKTKSQIITNIMDKELERQREKEQMEKLIRDQMEKEFALKMEMERRQLQEQMRRELEEARERLEKEKKKSIVIPAVAPPTVIVEEAVQQTSTPLPPLDPILPSTVPPPHPTGEPKRKSQVPVGLEQMDHKIKKLQQKIKRLDEEDFGGNEAAKDDLMRRLEEQILSLYDSAARLDALAESKSPPSEQAGQDSTDVPKPTESAPLPTPAIPSPAEPSTASPKETEPTTPEATASVPSPIEITAVSPVWCAIPSPREATASAKASSNGVESPSPVKEEPKATSEVAPVQRKWKTAQEPFKRGRPGAASPSATVQPSAPTATTTTTTTTTIATTTAAPTTTTGKVQISEPKKEERNKPAQQHHSKGEGSRSPQQHRPKMRGGGDRDKDKDKKRSRLSSKMKHSLLNLWEREHLSEAEQKKVIETRKGTLAKRQKGLLPLTQEEIMLYKRQMIEKYEMEKLENDRLLALKRLGTPTDKLSGSSALSSHRSARLAATPSPSKATNTSNNNNNNKNSVEKDAPPPSSTVVDPTTTNATTTSDASPTPVVVAHD